ncbi:MAG: bacteriocin family protein [Desulfotomaculum sp.]|nr:bacteriocin family protein [Desulfotomaculum sp.]
MWYLANESSTDANAIKISEGGNDQMSCSSKSEHETTPKAENAPVTETAETEVHVDTHTHTTHDSSANHSDHSDGSDAAHDGHSGAGGHLHKIPSKGHDVKHYLKNMNKMVRKLAAQKLVGRKMIATYGPIGGGMQSISEDIYGEKDGAKLDLLGTGKMYEIEHEVRNFIKLPIIYKDFVLNWRDIELAQYNNIPIDLSPVEHAASQVFYAEDDMIFNGAPEYDQPGLLNVSGHNKFTVNGWSKAGDGLKSVVAALAVLYKNTEVGPFTMALHPDLFAALHQLYGESGLLEIGHIEKLVTKGVYPTPVLPAGTGVLFPLGSDILDLVIGKPEMVVNRCHRDLNPEFRVLETVGLRIKNPAAICVFRTE